MTAAKHTDPIVGMDMHMIQPPPPAPPMMVPHPVAGMVMDPADYAPGACTTYVNGLPRARAGNVCMLSPPHVPIGGTFVKPPTSEAELYQGSSTVVADGEAMSAMGHQVLGCHDVGMPAPARAWKSGAAKSLMMAGSVVLPIPGGPPVNVGGAPTTSASGQRGDGLETATAERKVRFSVTFRRNGIERRNETCEVSVDGSALGEVTSTDVRGRVDVLVPVDARALVVVFAKGTGAEETWNCDLHTLDAPETPRGAKQRLSNLGLLVGSADEASDEATKDALVRFQVRASLPATGELDAATLARIQAEHKS